MHVNKNRGCAAEQEELNAAVLHSHTSTLLLKLLQLTSSLLQTPQVIVLAGHGFPDAVTIDRYYHLSRRSGQCQLLLS